MRRRPLLLIASLLVLPCAEAADGNTCADPHVLTINPAALPLPIVDTTCDRGDDYHSVNCVDLYDNGQDIIYRLDVVADACLFISVLDAQREGVVLGTSCPPTDDCLAYEVDANGKTDVRLDVLLPTGTYYLMIDTWPGPDCTPFTLIFESCGPPAAGDSCATPDVVTLPADLSYVETNGTTCGHGDFYHDPNACLREFGGGEDYVYRLDVTSPIAVEITLDPHDSAWTALALSDTCPPGRACIAAVHSDKAAPYRLPCTYLAPGTYYLVVDSWPLPTCIPDFKLTIVSCTLPTGACCVNSMCTGTVAEHACLAQAGRWFAGLDCDTFACPIAVDPLPDACAGAYAVSTLPFTGECDTSTAAADGPAGQCNATSAEHMQQDVWFTYTPTAHGWLQVSATYDYDGLTVVHAGPDCDHLTEWRCLDSGWQSRPDHDSATLLLTAGQRYWLQLGDWGEDGAGGGMVLSLEFTPLLIGDVNCDEAVDFSDINPFVLLLIDPPGYTAAYPDCPPLCGDGNLDGTIDGGDINPFVSALLQ